MIQYDFKIAIIGSGPSGCYAAQFLNKSLPQASIYVFEQLPVPYGLLRYGIASDHQGSKNISRQFDRIFSHPNIHFCGNICIGRDILFESLKENFNLILLATGLESDKKLNINVSPECQILGAGTLLKSLNSHPDYISKFPCALGSEVSIIGAGNVSMDVIRLLCAKDENLIGSDINDEYFDIITSKKIQKINVFSRSSAYDTKFDLSMLKEILALKHILVRFSDDDGVFSSLETQQIQGENISVEVTFHFNVSPLSVYKEKKQNMLAVERRSDLFESIFYSDCLITAIGFENTSVHDHQNDWSGDFVFTVGWLRSKGIGTVAANRKVAKTVVDEIIQKIENNSDHSDLKPKVFNTALQKALEKSVSFEQWLQIDAFEKRFKPANRCRRKVTMKSTMLMIASSSESLAEKSSTINIV